MPALREPCEGHGHVQLLRQRGELLQRKPAFLLLHPTRKRIQADARATQTFVTGIAFTHLAWKYYFLFIAWDSLQFLVIYLCYVETKRRTLEELTEIFRSARPVKTSLGTTVVVVREGRGVEVVDDESVGVGKDSRESRWSWE